MTEESPEGWASVKLEQIADKVGSGSTPRGGSDAYHQTGIPLIRSMNVRFEGFSNEGLAFLNQSQAAQLKEVTVRSGDVLLNITGASIGRVTQAPPHMDGARVNQHVCIIRSVPDIDGEYLSNYLASPSVQRMIWNEQYGVTRQALTKGQILDFDVPVPPRNEQRRMMATIRALIAQRNSALDHFSRVSSILKRFRQAVLAAACSGRLTEDWRHSHESHDPRMDALRCPTPERSTDGNPDMPELPSSWCWATIGQIASPQERSIQSGPFGSHLHHSEFQENGVLAIGIDNVLEGQFSRGKQHRISDAKYQTLKKFTARPNDVLITVMATVGRCCVIPESIEVAIITKHVYRITVDHNVCDPHFLMFALMGDVEVRSQIESQTRGQTRPGINGQILRRLAVPIPPLVEQQEIRQRLEAMFQFADKVEQKVAAAVSKANKLTQSILAKAIRGELVPTEAELARREGRDYEPASVLLERIKREREKETRPNGRSRKLVATE
jgi:type I restriction enzyme S subunit